MQVHRRFKLATPLTCTILVALGAAVATGSPAQTQLRPPVGNLGSPARLGAINPAASPASSPALSALRTPAALSSPQAVQAPLSQSTPLAPRSYGATPVQAPMANTPATLNTLPRAYVVPSGGTPTVTPPDGNKVPQAKLPQRLQCLTKFALEGMWDGRSPAVALTCEVRDQWVLMEFVVPNKQVFDTLVAAQKSGFSLWIDYTNPAAAEGNPKQQMMMVGAQEAYQSYQRVVCMGSGSRRALHVGPRGDQAYPQFTTWCTDGKRVTPITFASDKTSWALLLTNIEDGAVAIDYQLVMGGRHPKTGVVRPYPIEWITSINGKDLISGAGYPMQVSGQRSCKSDYVGPTGAAGCIGLTTLPPKGQQPKPYDKTTTFNTFFDGVASPDTTPVPQYHLKSVYYTLMPGVVPPEFRNASNGACRVAIYRYISVVQDSKNTGLGIGHASREPHPKDGYCRKTFGNSTAVWAFSQVRQEELCFPSLAAKEAEDQAVADKHTADQIAFMKASDPNYGKPPPPPTADTCQLLQ